MDVLGGERSIRGRTTERGAKILIGQWGIRVDPADVTW